jgi:hypothetical protein
MRKLSLWAAVLAAATTVARAHAPIQTDATASKVKTPEQVLAAARSRLGGDAAIDSIRTIDALAACRGPRSRYQTRVRSAKDGRVIFEQRFEDGSRYRALIGLEGGWEWSGDSSGATPASALAGVEAHGHEIDMLVLAPASRLGRPVGVVDTIFRGDSAAAVIFRDALGGRVTAYFRRVDFLPLGFRFPNHRDQRPAIDLVLSEWARVGSIRVPMRAVFWQGSEAYRFHFTRIQINTVPDSVFAASPPTR